MRGNDEALMTNNKGMTKSEVQNTRKDRGPFGDKGDTALVRDEADAVSKKEFLKSIGTCKKAAREVKHFLCMAVRAVPALKPEARKLWLEARELHLIFSKIWRSGKNE